MVALRKFTIEKVGFVSSAIFPTKQVLGLALPGGTVSQMARHSWTFMFLLQS